MPSPRPYRLNVIVDEKDAARLRRIAKRMGMRGAASLVSLMLREGRPLFERLDEELSSGRLRFVDFVSFAVEFIEREKEKAGAASPALSSSSVEVSNENERCRSSAKCSR